MAIHFNSIGTPIVIDYSIIHHSAVNVTGLFDYETFNTKVDYPYWTLPEGDPNKYYVASTPDSPLPLAYRNHRGTDSQKGLGSILYGINNCVVTNVEIGVYNILSISDGVNTYQYWHCSQIFVSVGERVNNNTTVALEGSAGADNSHLHFVVIDNQGRVIDGLNIMAGENTDPPTASFKKSLWFLDIW